MVKSQVYSNHNGTAAHVAFHSKFLHTIEGLREKPNKFHNYETMKITRKASDAAEYIELFGSSTRDRHARPINVIL